MSDLHDRFRASLAAHLAEVLSEDESAWMEAHARECAECAGLLERVRERLPGLELDGGHAPAALIARWIRSSPELTPLERELVERHLAECEVCRGDAEEMSKLAGLPAVLPLRTGPKVPAHSSLLVRVAASAAVIAVVAVIAVQLTGRRETRLAGPSPGTITRPGGAEPGATPRAREAVTIKLLDRDRAEAGEVVPSATLVADSTRLLIQLPPIFLGSARRVTARVVLGEGTLIWERVLNAEALARPLEPEVATGVWTPGRYRLEIVPEQDPSGTSTRTYKFELKAVPPVPPVPSR